MTLTNSYPIQEQELQIQKLRNDLKAILEEAFKRIKCISEKLIIKNLDVWTQWENTKRRSSKNKTRI